MGVVVIGVECFFPRMNFEYVTVEWIERATVEALTRRFENSFVGRVFSVVWTPRFK